MVVCMTKEETLEIYIDSFELADVVAVRELLRVHSASWVL